MTNENTSPQSEKPPIKRLYRSRKQRILGGICGGLAEYFNVDVVVIRVFWILITLFGGAGVIAYLILWVIVPPAPDDGIPKPSGGSGAGAFWGVALILLGLALLFAWRASHLWLFNAGGCPPFSTHFTAWTGDWVFSAILPGLIIAIGLGFLIGGC
jgi:phage shock protein PspC (stress-responsive transcriptional regulator)